MYESVRKLVAMLLAAGLVACGGGGGGGGGTTATPAAVASTEAFQLRTAYANSFQLTGVLNFSVRATLSNGVTATGSGTLTLGAVTATTYDGKPALRKSLTSDMSVTANGTTVPSSATTIVYSAPDFLPVSGATLDSSEFPVIQGVANIPVTVRVNDSGIMYVATRYASSAKTTVVGTSTATFTILPDTANTAILRVVTVLRDNANIVQATNTEFIRITPAGVVTYLSETGEMANGTNITITYQN
jgi:hypothetical protein